MLQDPRGNYRYWGTKYKENLDLVATEPATSRSDHRFLNRFIPRVSYLNL